MGLLSLGSGHGCGSDSARMIGIWRGELFRIRSGQVARVIQRDLRTSHRGGLQWSCRLATHPLEHPKHLPRRGSRPDGGDISLSIWSMLSRAQARARQRPGGIVCRAVETQQMAGRAQEARSGKQRLCREMGAAPRTVTATDVRNGRRRDGGGMKRTGPEGATRLFDAFSRPDGLRTMDNGAREGEERWR